MAGVAVSLCDNRGRCPWVEGLGGDPPAGLSPPSEMWIQTRAYSGQPAQVIELRLRHRWGADHIAHEVKLAASTAQNILRAAGRAASTEATGSMPARSSSFDSLRRASTLWPVRGPNVKDAGEFPMNSFS